MLVLANFDEFRFRNFAKSKFVEHLNKIYQFEQFR